MHCDDILKNGRVLDGTGNPWFRAEIGITDGRIDIIRPYIQGNAKEIVDIGRYFVSPGFIDLHCPCI